MATNNADNFGNPIGVANGGIGVASLTTYAPLCGGTTSTGAVQQATTGMGTSNYLITSGGASTLPTWKPGGAGLIKIATLTASSSASLTFTSSNITSTYTSYMIVMEDIGPASTSAQVFGMTFSTNNGSTYLSTGYQSGWSQVPFNSSTWATVNTTTQCDLGGNFGTLGKVFNGQIFINIPQNGIVSYVGRAMTQLTTPVLQNLFGNNSGTTTVNNIKFALTNGNILQGTVTLYGIPQ